MKTYQPQIPNYGYRLGATEEIRAALISLGFRFPNPQINRGCHWGEVYFFDEDLELAKTLIDPKDRYFRIDTETRYFYVSPCTVNQDTENKWQFSISPNKPKEYKPRVRKKHGPYYKQ